MRPELAARRAIPAAQRDLKDEMTGLVPKIRKMPKAPDAPVIQVTAVQAKTVMPTLEQIAAAKEAAQKAQEETQLAGEAEMEQKIRSGEWKFTTIANFEEEEGGTK